MLKYPEIDPVAISLGTHQIFGKTFSLPDIHWYGLMYLFGFASAWLLGLYRASKPHTALQKNQVEDMIFYGALGLVIGARMGYVFFYNFGAFLEDPIWLLRVWEGGMSFHGGMLGVLVAMGLYARKIQVNFLDLMDFLVPLAPIGLCFGRLGNFIGQELWGRETTAAIGMIFPNDPEALVRHPSQLYQASLEGVLLFVLLFWYSSKPRPRASVGALFLILYGCFRFIIEFYREPDAHIGFDLFEFFTRGQLLTVPMAIAGAAIMVWSYKSAAKKQVK
ncbi:Prolipoprotein diacylglyceryl transferase [Alteromonadaceae bacterium Bs31]|nr:Prolipoprotein diacylglyceryl transferase [Alteromonadaceae bacterium Bs31]